MARNAKLVTSLANWDSFVRSNGRKGYYTEQGEGQGQISFFVLHFLSRKPIDLTKSTSTTAMKTRGASRTKRTIIDLPDGSPPTKLTTCGGKRSLKDEKKIQTKQYLLQNLQKARANPSRPPPTWRRKKAISNFLPRTVS